METPLTWRAKRMSSDESVRTKIIFGMSVSCIIVGLYISSLYSYPLFHGLIEIATIAVAFTLFMLTWNARQYIRNGFLELIGIGYAFIALIDMIHALSYKGVNLFPGYSANLPTQLWIAARYLQAITLVAASLLLEKKPRYYAIFAGFTIVTFVLVGSIFSGWFPDCYIEGQGLTRFKVASEYIISIILLCSLVMLVRKRAYFDADIFRLIAASVLFTAASELAFTAYVSVYGLANLAGHYFKLIAFYLIYRAILVSGITKPFSLIFRKCRQVEEELQTAHDSLAMRVTERTAELEVTMRELEQEISERKLAEEALREAEERFHTIFDSVNDAIFVHDPGSGGIIDVNRRMCEMYGYTREEVLSADVGELSAGYPPYTRREAIACLERAQTGENVVTDWLARHRDGRLFWVEISIRQATITGHERLLVVVRDIGDRKQSEEEMRKSEALLKEAQRIARLGSWELDVATGALVWSDEIYRIFEKDQAIFLGTYEAFLDMIHPEDREMVNTAYTVSVREKKPYEIVHRLKFSDNRVKYVREKCETLYDSAGNPVRSMGTVQDITEQQLAEERAIQLSSIVESSDDAIIGKTLDGVITSWNLGAQRIYGYSEEEVLGRPISLLAPDDRQNEVIEILNKIRSGVHIEHFETVRKRKTGELIHVSLSVSPIWDAQGRLTGASTIARNITEQKRLEDQLRQSQKMEAIGQLAGGIAHDFNNILSAIIGYGDTMKRNMAADDLLRPHLEQILESADRAAQLTKSLLAFSRNQVMNPKPADMNEIVRKIEQFLLRVIGEDIELKTKLADRKLPVLVDTGQIDQALMNLATNARDAMPRGGVLTIDTDVMTIDDDFGRAHGYGRPGEYVLVTVTDTGIGMNEETRLRIFEPFFTTKEMGKGTGLGMSIVYGIVKQHSGYINVYSEPGQGTMFRIYLPLIRDAATEEIKPEVRAYPARGTETILVAEDDATLRKLSDSVLKEFGYTVILAEDGEDAIEKFKQNSDSIKLLVLDMIMPRKNGKEAYEAIKKINPDIKVLFASGYTADIMHKKGILDEGLEFVMKPLSPMDLLRKVREILDRGGNSGSD